MMGPGRRIGWTVLWGSRAVSFSCRMADSSRVTPSLGKYLPGRRRGSCRRICHVELGWNRRRQGEGSKSETSPPAQVQRRTGRPREQRERRGKTVQQKETAATEVFRGREPGSEQD